MALGSVRRWVLDPAWTAAPEPKREEWPCPACSRTVWRTNPAWKGIWFAPVEAELLSRCARQHATHDRHGRPFAADEITWRPVVGLDELADLDDPLARRLPVVALDGGALVALLPPAGVRLEPVDDGFDLQALDDLQPSDLVGRGGKPGRTLGHLPPGALLVEDGTIDARALRAAFSPRAG